MKIDADMSDFAAIMITAIASCTSIILGIQGLVFKDSFLRKNDRYKMESIVGIIIGLMGFIAVAIMIFKQ